MSKLKLVLLFSMVAVMAFAVCGYSQAQNTYKVGAIFSVTGPGSSLGTPEKNTIDMLVDEINAAGGVNGKKLEVIFYDDASDETNCRNKASKLINDDKVAAIIGPTLSGTSLSILGITQNAEIPLVSCAASVKIVEPVSDRKWVFKTPQSDFLVAERIVDYLKAQKITKVAIMTVKTGFGASGKEQLEALLPPAGIDILIKEEFNEKDPDVLVQLTKVRAADAQAIICWSLPPGGATLTRNMKKDLRMDIPLIMSHGVANMEYINLSADAAEGVVFPAGKLLIASLLPDSDPQKKILVKYAKDYEAKYGSVPSTFGGHAWDALYLVVEAMKKAGSDPAKIRAELEKIKDFVGTGGVFNFSATDHNGLVKDCLVMIKISNGKWTLMK